MSHQGFDPIPATATIRPLERDAICRLCQAELSRGWTVATWKTHLGNSPSVVLCFPCIWELEQAVADHLEPPKFF